MLVSFCVCAVLLCVTLPQHGCRASMSIMRPVLRHHLIINLDLKGDCRLLLSTLDVQKVKSALVAGIDFLQYDFYDVGDYGATNPLRFTDTWVYKSARWVRTRNRRGPYILNTIFSLYGVTPLHSSFNWLVTPVALRLSDAPAGCLANLTSFDKVNLMMRLVLDDFDLDVKYDDGQDVVLDIWACHQIVQPAANRSQVTFDVLCCKGGRGQQRVVCMQVQFASRVLEVMLNGLRAVAFLFGPLLVPAWTCHTALTYVLRLKQPLRRSMWVSRAAAPPARLTATETLDLRGAAGGPAFAKCRRTAARLPADRKLNVAIGCYDIRVDDDELLTEEQSPLNVTQSVVANVFLCRCVRSRLFRNCCATDDGVVNCTRHAIVCNIVGRILLVLLVPAPYYACVVLFVLFQYPEIANRRRVAALWDTRLTGDDRVGFHPTSAIHVAACATFLSVAILLVCMRGTRLYARMREAVMLALIDLRTMSAVAVVRQAGVMLARLVRRKRPAHCLLGLLLLPIVMPLVAVASLLYCLPIVFLCWRIGWHVLTLDVRPSGPPPRQWDYSGLERQLTSDVRAGLSGGRRALRHLAAVVALLAMFCSLMLLLSAVTSFVAKILWLILLEMIVNMSRYAPFAIACVAHAYDCYSVIYRKYCELNRSLFGELKGRLKKDVDEFVVRNYADQNNRAFRLSGNEDSAGDGIRPRESSSWTARHGPGRTGRGAEYHLDIDKLLFFVDQSDYPRIPRKLFDEICQIRTVGGVGPPLRSLVTATATFLGRMIFLAFVYMTIIAVGDQLYLSSTTQFLGSWTGSFLPLLRKLFAKTNTGFAMSVSFRCHMEEIINKYEETWPMTDVEFEVDLASDNGGEQPVETPADGDSDERVDLLLIIDDDVDGGGEVDDDSDRDDDDDDDGDASAVPLETAL